MKKKSKVSELSVNRIKSICSDLAKDKITIEIRKDIHGKNKLIRFYRFKESGTCNMTIGGINSNEIKNVFSFFSKTKLENHISN